MLHCCQITFFLYLWTAALECALHFLVFNLKGLTIAMLTIIRIYCILCLTGFWTTVKNMRPEGSIEICIYIIWRHTLGSMYRNVSKTVQSKTFAFRCSDFLKFIFAAYRNCFWLLIIIIDDWLIDDYNYWLLIHVCNDHRHYFLIL